MDSTISKDGTSAEEHPHVHEVAGVCGGYPVIRNTRIPVWMIVEFYRELGEIDRIAEMYPHVGKDRIQGALDFYAAHPDRVDEDRDRNERAYAELSMRNAPAQGRSWPG